MLQYYGDMEFAEKIKNSWRTADGTHISIKELSWIVVIGCAKIPTFAFEPSYQDEIVSILSGWRQRSGIGCRGLTYGIFWDGGKYRISTMADFLTGRPCDHDLDLIFHSPEAEDQGLVAILG